MNTTTMNLDATNEVIMMETISNPVENLCLRALREELKKLQGKNPAYSIRAFARDLEISHSFLNKVLNGKSSTTPRLAYQLGLFTNRSIPDTLELITSTFTYQDDK